MHKMNWDGAASKYTITMMSTGDVATFQLLLGGNVWSKRIWPSRSQANPWGEPYSVIGPTKTGDEGHGKDWAIGIDPRDGNAPGAQYEIVLRCPGGDAKEVTWEKK